MAYVSDWKMVGAFWSYCSPNLLKAELALVDLGVIDLREWERLLSLLLLVRYECVVSELRSGLDCTLWSRWIP